MNEEQDGDERNEVDRTKIRTESLNLLAWDREPQTWCVVWLVKPPNSENARFEARAQLFGQSSSGEVWEEVGSIVTDSAKDFKLLQKEIQVFYSFDQLSRLQPIS